MVEIMSAAGADSSLDMNTTRVLATRQTGFPDTADHIASDIAFLSKFGIGRPYLIAATRRALAMRGKAASILIHSGAISEVDYYRCAAFELGLEFADETPNTGEPFLLAPEAADLDRMARMVAVDQDRRRFHIVPDMADTQKLRELINAHPDFADRIRIVPASANLKALRERSEESFLRTSVDWLREKMPDFSARETVTVRQAVLMVLLVQAILLISVFAQGAVLFAFHLSASLFYLSCIALRLFSALRPRPQSRIDDIKIAENLAINEPADLPVYSVLVALYHEAGQVPQLVAALKKLNWPAEKLEIKLICEADDHATLSAVHSILKGPGLGHFECISVPVHGPRTKPKALNFALPQCKGRYLVIFDAEDRPHPNQLLEAYSTFLASDERMACLQAPLVIHNGESSWLTKLFAIEYSSLFDGLLPVLAGHSLPLPLGGTSNHFKRSVLERIGSWDAFNVTEDADLGIRLARFGYLTGTIALPTYEEAPSRFRVWLKQRTRWMKGWMQTWFVHMRHPIELAKNLGISGTLAFHILITGMVVSALVHPILLYFAGVLLFPAMESGTVIPPPATLYWLDLTSILMGYLAFSILALRTLPIRKLMHLSWGLLLIPIYWMLLSVAAWRALVQLTDKPHLCGLR